MAEVMKANPPGSGFMNSRGSASYMLISQYQFPFTYEDSEELYTRDSDRLMMFDSEHCNACFKKYCNDCGQFGFDMWIKRQHDHKKMLEFLTVFTKADQTIPWSGYRIMGTVGGNGHSIWTLQLFAKREDSLTKVYSGSVAPNVETPEKIEG